MPKIKFAGYEVEGLPSWVNSILGVLVCAGATWWLYSMVAPPPAAELISVKQANEQLQLEVDHYNRHIVDEPTASLQDPTGSVSVRAYGDACLLVSQRVGMTSATRLLIGPGAERRRASAAIVDAMFPVLEASAAAQGRCLSPHPGRFSTFYGQRQNECVVEVFRHFEDGCQHAQLFDACRGSWQTNADGSPRVRWTRCLH